MSWAWRQMIHFLLTLKQVEKESVQTASAAGWREVEVADWRLAWIHQPFTSTICCWCKLQHLDKWLPDSLGGGTLCNHRSTVVPWSATVHTLGVSEHGWVARIACMFSNISLPSGHLGPYAGPLRARRMPDWVSLPKFSYKPTCFLNKFLIERPNPNMQPQAGWAQSRLLGYEPAISLAQIRAAP